MNEFVFLYRGGLSPDQRSPQELEASMNQWRAWAGKLSAEGQLKDFGVPLQREGRTVAVGGVITDGPYTEGKEIIGGFSIIKAKDISEAAKIAKGCPIFENGGTVEVRPVQAM